MAKLVSFEQVNPAAAAIDIGASKVFVSTDGVKVKNYQTYTADYRTLVQDLLDERIERVCMEATGVYWIALYEMLEDAGLEVCLVNPKEVKQVKGRKTDPKDCRWIQRVFSAGLVRQSYVPAGKLKELRMMVRERADIIEVGSGYINKMGKYLELMNIKLTTTIDQIQGVSGLRMIEAIIAGERDPNNLLLLCDKRIIKAKKENILKALDGNYNESWIFLLEQNLHLWKQHEAHLVTIDKKIEELLDALVEGKEEVQATHKPKPIRHHAPSIKNLHQKLLNIYGVDCNTLSGITDYTLLRLLAEVGTDMTRFPTAKHFASYLQLTPSCNQSGKMHRRIKMKSGSKAGQIFRQIAYGLLGSKKIALGAFMRRIRSRKGSVLAVKAGARKLAVAFYNLLTKGAEYVEYGARKYEEQLEAREQAFLFNLAKKHKLILLPQHE